MWLSDPEGNLLLINKTCLELLHLAPEDVIRKYNVLKDNIIEEQGKMHLVRKVFEEKETVNFELLYDPAGLYLEGLVGVQVILDVTISPVLDEDGNLIHALIMHKDLTQQKAYEDLLKRNEAERNMILNSLPDYVSLIDTEYRYQWANHSLLNSLGVSLEEIKEKKCYEVIWGEDEPCKNCRIPEVLESGKSTRYLVKDTLGNTRDIITIPVVEKNTIIGVVEISRDITERIRAEEQRNELERQIIGEQLKVNQALEMDRLKTSFMSTATHEIRTPLTSILGYIELIDEAIIAEDLDTVFRYYDILKRNANRLYQLTDNLLDIQRIESKRLEIFLSRFSIKETVDLVLKELAPLHSEENIEIETVYHLSNDNIEADKARLQQMLINLLSNSIKFSPPQSKITLIVEENEQEYRFRIIDQGIGFTPEEKIQLFKPFPDIHPLVKGKGSGLGLSICKGIVDLHGGKIWAKSDGIGTGSEFIFTIPKTHTH
jgi:PAS domain S-box-containing protein